MPRLRRAEQVVKLASGDRRFGHSGILAGPQVLRKPDRADRFGGSQRRLGRVLGSRANAATCGSRSICPDTATRLSTFRFTEAGVGSILSAGSVDTGSNSSRADGHQRPDRTAMGRQHVQKLIAGRRQFGAFFSGVVQNIEQ